MCNNFYTDPFLLTDEDILSVDFPIDIQEQAEASRDRIFDDIMDFVNSETKR